MKNKKAQAGLNIFLSVIALLFVIGIIIMAFALAGSQIISADSSYDRTSAIVVVAESKFMNGSIGYIDLTASSLKRSTCTISAVYNDSALIGAGNYTVSNCRITNTTTTFPDELWYTNYSYTYLAHNEVADVMNNTVIAVSGATDWFAIFITITAVVVLILLIVLIIVSLRGAGLMDGGKSGPGA